MSYYMITDGHGNAITDGLPEETAHATAQRIANERGETVYLSANDEDEETAVEPTAHRYALTCIECGHDWTMELDQSWERYEGEAEFDAQSACPECGANGAEVRVGRRSA